MDKLDDGGFVLEGVASGSVPALWPHVVAMLARACRRSGAVTVEALRENCIAGRNQLWVWLRPGPPVVLRAALVTCVYVQGDGRRVCELMQFGFDGARRHLDALHAHIRHIEAWAIEQGCDLMRSHSRLGMRLVMPADYRPRLVILEKWL